MSGEEDENGNLTVKLTDFGLSTSLKEGDDLSQAIGSPIYMAPEVAKKESYNEKIDIWGIGVVAHIVLTGQPPFQGTHEEIKDAIINQKPKFGRVKS